MFLLAQTCHPALAVSTNNACSLIGMTGSTVLIAQGLLNATATAWKISHAVHHAMGSLLRPNQFQDAPGLQLTASSGRGPRGCAGVESHVGMTTRLKSTAHGRLLSLHSLMGSHAQVSQR